MRYILLCLLLILNISVNAQKQKLNLEAFKTWELISKEDLSYNGNWMFYKTTFHDLETESDNKTIVKNTQNNKSKVFKDVDGFSFIGTKNWVRYTKNDTVFLENLSSGKKKIWDIKDYTQSVKGTDFLSYTHYGAFKDGKALKKVVYYNIEKNDSIILNNILKLMPFKDSKSVLFSQEEAGQVYLKYGVLGSSYKTLYQTSANVFGDFVLNSKNDGGSFTLKASEASQAANLLYYFNISTGKTKQVLNFDDIKLSDSLYLLSKQPYQLDEVTKLISVQIQPNYNAFNSNNHVKKNAPEIWTWNEGTTTRRQEKLRGRTPMPTPPYYVYNTETKATYEVNTGTFDKIIAPDTNNTFTKVIKSSIEGHEVSVDWKFNQPQDLYFVDLETNRETKLLENVTENPMWNSAGTYAIIYNNEKRVWMYLDANATNPQFKPIGEAINYPLWDKLADMGEFSSAYGIAGWLNNGNTVVLYDEFDLWAIDLTQHTKPYSVTKQYGRNHKVKLRLHGSTFGGNLNLNEPLLLNTFNTVTKAEGVYQLKGSKVSKIAESSDYSISIKAISGDGSGVLFTKESYTQFPNLWYANQSFKKEKQLTNLNTQQEYYAWGSAKLVQWETFNGEENEGILYVPENYDANKSYPVIVHFYEKHTQDFFKYHLPELSTSNINIPDYVSKGYIVFMPDVHYVHNQPGNSAYNCVVSGVEALIKKGIAKRGKIGIQGHSFSGYQTSYLLTKTNVFDCAVVGSGVSNFTANYFSYRSNGISNMFKYEVDQYRMNGSFFDNKEQFFNNSSVFRAELINTPTLVFHNDNDLAVPYQEGLGLFFALRRLGKPSWLINYKGEGHTLSKYESQIDWTNRMQAYFDFYLKEAKQPDWM